MPEIITRVIDAYVFIQTTNSFKFLLLKRATTKMYEHLWQGVAGKIEKGETAAEAAIRELEEETGFRPIRMFVADHVSKFYEAHEDRINLIPVFGIEVDDSNVILSEEHSEFNWLSYEMAVKTLVWKGQKEGISAVYDMLISNDDRIKWTKIL
ncbi:MAG: NUDIX pyrophosphatase [Candidatus Neomarinimicrobiota bacterium]